MMQANVNAGNRGVGCLIVFFVTGLTLLGCGTTAHAMPGIGNDRESTGTPAATNAPESTGALESPDAAGSGVTDDGRLLAPRKKSARRGREPRLWSIGGRVGSLGNMGILTQYIGEGAVAWNFGINFKDYGGNPALGMTLERLLLFDDDFNSLTWGNLPKWHESRGKIVYLAGPGVQMDAQGLYPRISAGAQYTMVGDPLTWSAQATLFVGQLAGTKPEVGLGITPEIGVRYVLE